MSVPSGDGKGEYLLMPYEREEWGELQTFEVLEQPEDAKLEVGVVGSIFLLLDEKKDVLCVPRDAIHMAEDKPYVYMMNEDRMRKVVFVETGLYGNDSVEITSGLAEGILQ